MPGRTCQVQGKQLYSSSGECVPRHHQRRSGRLRGDSYHQEVTSKNRHPLGPITRASSTPKILGLWHDEPCHDKKRATHRPKLSYVAEQPSGDGPRARGLSYFKPTTRWYRAHACGEVGSCPRTSSYRGPSSPRVRGGGGRRRPRAVPLDIEPTRAGRWGRSLPCDQNGQASPKKEDAWLIECSTS